MESPKNVQKIYKNVSGDYKLTAQKVPDTAADVLPENLDVPVAKINSLLSFLASQAGKSIEEVRSSLAKWIEEASLEVA